MAVHEGIVLYDIGLDGCLNGVYANEQNPDAGRVFNEIARKTTDVIGIIGRYDCFYFETGSPRQRNVRRNSILVISQTSPGNVFRFEWLALRGRRRIFVGIGYQMNERQLAVHYKSIP